MQTIFLSDRLVSIGSARTTRDGYLAATARVARSGIQEYIGHEIGLATDEIFRVYRPEDEVFSDDTMRTFAHRPITIDHPPEAVTANNWKQHAVGYSGGDVVRDGEKVDVQLLLTDSAAIAAYNAGKRELSMGYECEIDWAAGVTDSGEHYDAIQRKIRNNHIAMVDRGRAGSDIRIKDTHTGGDTMPERKITVDGITIDVTDQGAQVIEKLQKQIVDHAAVLDAAKAEHDKAVAAKDAEIATKDAEIDALKAQVMTADAMDKAIAERADLIGKAKRVADIDYAGMNASEIRAAAVKARIGDAAKDKSDAYIEARFDVLLETLTDKKPDEKKPIEDAQTAYEARIRDAWKGGAK